MFISFRKLFSLPRGNSRGDCEIVFIKKFSVKGTGEFLPGNSKSKK